MKPQENVIDFAGTKEQEAQLMEVIRAHKDDKGGLIAVLNEAQKIYGYLPIEVQTIISNELNMPLEKIYGVVTFYSNFSLIPKGKYNVSVCMGTACYVQGAGDVLNKFTELLDIPVDGCTEDGNFSIEACRCIGACGLAPILTINDDVHGKISADDVKDILAKYQ